MAGGPKGLSVFLDVNFYDHPKVVEAGERADRLYTQALCLAKRTWSDGFVSDEQVKRFGLSGVAGRAGRLVDVGLFTRDDDRGGWWIHDFLEHNRSRAEQEEISEKRRRAGKKGGRPPNNQSENQVANQSENQGENQEVKQAENPEVFCSDTDLKTTTNSQTRPAATDPVEGVHEAAMAKLRITGAHPKRSDLEAIERALQRGHSPDAIAEFATTAASKDSPRAWLSAVWANLGETDPPADNGQGRDADDRRPTVPDYEPDDAEMDQHAAVGGLAAARANLPSGADA